MKPRAWFVPLALLILAGTLLRVSWLVSLGLAVSFVLGSAYWWQRQVLRNITYHRALTYTRGFPGETSTLRITVENQKRLPVSWLRVRDLWPLSIRVEPAEAIAPSHIAAHGYLTNTYHLLGFRRITRKFTLQFGPRGLYTLGPLTLESGDPFGLFERHEEREMPGALAVFPELLPRTALGLVSEDPFGDRQARRRLFEDPNLTIGVRPYYPEDTFRQIHWPATARTGQLQTRIYQPIASQVMVLCLNVTTSEHPWLGTMPEVLEQIIRVAASLCYYGIEDGYAVGLVANGGMALSDQPFQIRPGRTIEHLAWLLQSLAGVTPVITVPFERFLTQVVPRIPMGATLVVLTALVNESLLESLSLLHQYRHQLVLIAISETPPPSLPGTKVIHILPSTLSAQGSTPRESYAQ